jgi:hypothetical protein
MHFLSLPLQTQKAVRAFVTVPWICGLRLQVSLNSTCGSALVYTVLPCAGSDTDGQLSWWWRSNSAAHCSQYSLFHFLCEPARHKM